ncbi:MAG: UDP-N-acetylglucosamine 2-epimerase (non-hydrolyzing) [Xenococcaceae cyanobacterium MO_167.B27]|nr:UDP-N-acetylglucosamine 2-epimerase (non-hydrolyzing) [Xenococcaceae cyanobacterium MO_167.B27]
MTLLTPSVCVTLGTRPEAIKLAPVIQKLRSFDNLRTYVVLTGQHREMVDGVMELFNLESDRDLAIMKPKQTLTEITCNSLQGLEQIFRELQPQLVIVQGDTSTAFSAALAAFYQKIPVGHVEAGLRTDDLFNPYPEEANRRLISQIAQFHFAPTELAVQNLHKSGITGKIYQTGNTVIDALLQVAKTNPQCNIPGLDWSKYRVLLATVHRRENWGQPLQDILQGFSLILDRFPDTALLLPMHRNPTVREPIKAFFADCHVSGRVFLTEPLDYKQLVAAISRCYLLLTDSGGLQEEAPSLGKPVLVLRETTERQEAIAAGTAKLIGTNPDAIFNHAQDLLNNTEAYQKMATAINPFGDGLAAAKIVEVINNFLNQDN